MANAWSAGWGPASGVNNAWNVSWGSDAAVAVVAQHPGAAAWKPYKKKKKKPIVIHFSDLATREERAAALARALEEASIPLRKISHDRDDNEEIDEDELIIKALTVLMSRLH